MEESVKGSSDYEKTRNLLKANKTHKHITAPLTIENRN